MNSAEYLISLRDEKFNDMEAGFLPTESLTTSYSPRITGEDAEHILAMVESKTALPPIVVHRETMTIVDGVHRLRAAELKGESHVAVRFFDGTEADASVLAVVMNVAHGLPLSLADRVAAAERIFGTYPAWSDRAVASVTGLSANKVGEVRRRVIGQGTADGRRIGRDGRARPVNPARGRELASELIRDNPGASMRQIAKRAGISQATAADVRDRMERGLDPVPPKHRQAVQRERAEVTSLPLLPGRYVDRNKELDKLRRISDRLQKDPSLRYTEKGRELLRILVMLTHATTKLQGLVEGMPPHCTSQVSTLMCGYGEIWKSFGDIVSTASMAEADQQTPQAAQLHLIHS